VAKPPQAFGAKVFKQVKYWGSEPPRGSRTVEKPHGGVWGAAFLLFQTNLALFSPVQQGEIRVYLQSDQVQASSAFWSLVVDQWWLKGVATGTGLSSALPRQSRDHGKCAARLCD